MKIRADYGGMIMKSYWGNWSVLHDNSSGTSVTLDIINNDYVAGGINYSSSKSGSYQYLYRGFLSFDTSTLGIDYNITSARLWLYGESPTGSGCILQKGLQSNPLTIFDYSRFTGSGFGLCTLRNNSWNEMLFDSNGIEAINKTGATLLCLRQYYYDYLNIQRNSTVYNPAYFNACATHKPILEINFDSQLDEKGPGVLKINNSEGNVSFASLQFITTDTQANTNVRIGASDGEAWAVQSAPCVSELKYQPTTGASYTPNATELGVYNWSRLISTGAGANSSTESDIDCTALERYVLTTDYTTTNRLYFYQLKTAEVNCPVAVLSNSVGYKIETRLRAVTGLTGSSGIGLYDGTYYWAMRFAPWGCFIIDASTVEGNVGYNFDASSAYHKYNIYVSGSSFSVKIDDTTRIQATLNSANASSQQIQFGDIATTIGYGGTTYYDYFKYGVRLPIQIIYSGSSTRTLSMA